MVGLLVRVIEGELYAKATMVPVIKVWVLSAWPSVS